VARSERLTIRTKHVGDAPRDFEWRSDPELARFDGREPLAETLSEFTARMEYDLRFQNPRERLYALDTADGEHIGNLMYYNARPTRGEAEYGITIGRKDLYGQGYGREATILFLRHLWETSSFRLLVLHTFEWNERAARCFRGAGFEDAGYVERNPGRLLRMEARREWWLLHDSLGRFALDRGTTTRLTPERP
ncbi:MAG: GNAT family N-acetyltransferase, partial [Tepidiformaceae bacterium]